MGYRGYVENVQIFDAPHPEWIEFIRSQGIGVNEISNDEDCYDYKGEITDFMSALEVIEKITLRLNKEREEFMKKSNPKLELTSLFDLSEILIDLSLQDKDDPYSSSLFDELLKIATYGYAFMPYSFYVACKDKLEPMPLYSVKGHMHCFKLKDGETIHVHAS